jgi:hypothetical protein
MSNIEELCRESVRRFKKMPLIEQAHMRAAQRKSWVVGEMMLAHPEMDRAKAERLYYEIIGKE